MPPLVLSSISEPSRTVLAVLLYGLVVHLYHVTDTAEHHHMHTYTYTYRETDTERHADIPVTVMCALANELPAALSAIHEYSPESSRRADWMLRVPLSVTCTRDSAFWPGNISVCSVQLSSSSSQLSSSVNHSPTQ